MLHGLVLFATKLETADTLEVTVLHNYAPPLYSADNAFTGVNFRNNEGLHEA